MTDIPKEGFRTKPGQSHSSELQLIQNATTIGRDQWPVG